MPEAEGRASWTVRLSTVLLINRYGAPWKAWSGPPADREQEGPEPGEQTVPEKSIILSGPGRVV